MLEPLGKEPKRIDVHNDFDLFQEVSRGALYSGGKRAEEWWAGYAFGVRFVIVLLAGLFAYAVLKELVDSGDFLKMVTGDF